MTQDLYALLGVAPDASTEAIAAVCAEKLNETQDHNAKVVLRHAREVLCNPVSRSTYDLKLREQRTPGGLRPLPLELDEPSSSASLRIRLPVVLLIVMVVLGLIAWIWAKKTTASTAKPPSAVIVEQTRLVIQPAQAPNPPVNSAAALNPETLYAANAPSVVVVESIGANGQPFGRGSGVVIGSQSVITNCHVIDRAISVSVRSGAAEFAATSGTSDTYLDLCVLQVTGLSAPEVRRGSVKNLQVGQTVYAIGAPQGLDRTLSQGLISALRETPDGIVIQTSAAISPGSSGGGLFDAEGRLIGITTFQTKLGQNLNFALPVDWLESMRTR